MSVECMRRHLAALWTLILLACGLALVVPPRVALADDAYTSNDLTDAHAVTNLSSTPIYITKQVTALNTKVTGETCTISFTPQNGVGTTSDEAAKISDVEITIASDNADGVLTSYWSGQVTIPAAASYPHAGVYVYRVAEKGVAPGSSRTSTTSLVMSRAEYLMRVSIVNEGSSLKLSNITVEKSKDQEGNAATGKIDPTKQGDAEAEFVFRNVYMDVCTIRSKLRVEGNRADPSQKFPATFTITLPESVGDLPIPTTALVTEGNTKKTVPLTREGNKVKLGEGTVNIMDGNDIEIVGVPVGSTATVRVEGVDHYAPSAKVFSSADYTGTAAASKEEKVAQHLEFESVSAHSEGLSFDIVETYDGATPPRSGLSLSFGPYALVLGGALVFGAVWFLLGRRRGASA